MRVKIIYLPLLFLLLTSCSAAYLTLKSEPAGATVYAVPKLIHDPDTTLYSNPAHINAYIIKEGVTPVHTSLRKAAYVIVFVLGEKQKSIAVDLSGAGRKKGRTLEADLR